MNIDKIINELSDAGIKQALLKFFLFLKKNFFLFSLFGVALVFCMYELVGTIKDWTVYKKYNDAVIKNKEVEATTDKVKYQIFKIYEKECLVKWTKRLRNREIRGWLIFSVYILLAFLYFFFLLDFYVWKLKILKLLERKFKEVLS